MCDRSRRPTLTLCYLPHLDYGLQKCGPTPTTRGSPTICGRSTACAGELIAAAERDGARVIVVSEYGIVPVRDAVHINRVLREAGLVRLRVEPGRETLDAGASKAFAVADHQLAHVYVQHGADAAAVKLLLEDWTASPRCSTRPASARSASITRRSGELVALAAPDRWFTYYCWLDEALAPDFARTVDIHRKPGYDPMELFFDPAIRSPKLAIGWKLARRKLGFRQLLDITPITDTTVVKGSHGLITDDLAAGPLVISSEAGLLPEGSVAATGFKDLVLDHVFAA